MANGQFSSSTSTRIVKRFHLFWLRVLCFLPAKLPCWKAGLFSWVVGRKQRLHKSITYESWANYVTIGDYRDLVRNALA